MMVVMMPVPVLFMVVVLFVLMVLMSMFMLMMMFMLVMVVVVMLFVFVMMAFHFAYPCGGGGDFVEIEHARIQYLVELHLAPVAFYDFSFGLECTDYRTDSPQFFGRDLGGFVEQDYIAELYLLDEQILDVILGKIALEQVASAGEFVPHAESIHHRHYTVQMHIPVLDILRAHSGNGTDGLGNGFRLANAARLYHYIVKTAHGCDFRELLDEIHFEGTADTSVLESDEALVLFADNAAFLYEVGIDIHLSYVIDNDCEFDSFPV